jgi:Holliday junction resolvase RusA-like endonuclease
MKPTPWPLTFTVPGPPRGKAKKFGFGRGFNDAATQKYMNDIGWAAKAVIASRPFAVIDWPLQLRLLAVFPVPVSWSLRQQHAALAGEIAPTGKPDLDNIQKCVGDALKGIIWKDDAVITVVHARKIYGADPQLRIEISNPVD